MRLLKHSTGLTSRPATVLDIMRPNPKSISDSATVRECAQAMRQHGIHSAPVIDAAGHPVGVVSRSDVVEYWSGSRNRWMVSDGNSSGRRNRHHTEPGDDLVARDIMNPVLFDVNQNASIKQVIEKLLVLEVRCLFVTDDQGVLIGTVSVFDVLRYLVESSRQSGSPHVETDGSWDIPVPLRI